jgi:pyruvate-ferredoxin/flavodoxin oxidoreductase
LSEVTIPADAAPNGEVAEERFASAPPFVRDVLAPMMCGCGDRLPVSALPCDGTFPTGTARFEKRNLAAEVPAWDPAICVQCGKCVMVCPHAVIRSKVYDAPALAQAPAGFLSAEARLPEWKGLRYTLQVAPEDCTGCGLCVDVCPVKNKSQTRLKAINMQPQPPLLEQERSNWNFFLRLPDPDRRSIPLGTVRAMQPLVPLFEFSGACAGCGETPYLRLLTQLFGDRLLVANATGCSSIYGGNLPTTPWAQNAEGSGPAWSNSLFEDNAEFGLGYRVSLDKQHEFASELLRSLSGSVGTELAESILGADQSDEAGIHEQRERVAELKQRLAACEAPEAQRLAAIADVLVRKSVWIVGGDGWAYDIGFGGLDHVLASGRNVKVLVLDTEVYSNTGGQMSKATPRGAVAKFAAGGKRMGKKDLGLIAMTYGHVYVATVAMGAKDEQTLRVFLEAEAYDGPALIIAYSHCIAHGIDLGQGLRHQKLAVDSGQWLLYRHDPRRAARGENPLQVDSPPPRVPVREYLRLENRFRLLEQTAPDQAAELFRQAQQDADARFALYQYLAARPAAPAATPDRHEPDHEIPRPDAAHASRPVSVAAL